eukprot:984398_1
MQNVTDTTIWAEVASSDITETALSGPVSAIHCDYGKELIWHGTSEGSIVSSFVPSLRHRCRVRAHSRVPFYVLPNRRGVFSIAADGAQLHDVGGLFVKDFRSTPLADMTCATYSSVQRAIVIAGRSPEFALLDAHKKSMMMRPGLDSPVTHLAEGRSLCAATASGTLQTLGRDLRPMGDPIGLDGARV